MISFHGLLDVIAGDFSKLAKPLQGFMLRPPRIEVRRTRYSGEQLRKIRAEKGVGRPIGALSFDRIQELRWRGAKFYPAAAFASVELPSPNLAEWQRKPRRKDRSAA